MGAWIEIIEYYTIVFKMTKSLPTKPSARLNSEKNCRLAAQAKS